MQDLYLKRNILWCLKEDLEYRNICNVNIQECFQKPSSNVTGWYISELWIVSCLLNIWRGMMWLYFPSQWIYSHTYTQHVSKERKKRIFKVNLEKQEIRLWPIYNRILGNICFSSTNIFGGPPRMGQP